MTDKENKEVAAMVIANGPLILTGDFQLTHGDGQIQESGGRMSICRCGASGNKPFCDGSHKTSGFEG